MRSFTVEPRTPDFGGWRLHLIEDGEEMGGGVLESAGAAIEEGEKWIASFTVTLGRAVEIIQPLEVWMFMGGWGDGPMLLHPGSKLYLERQVGNDVIFSAGTKPDQTLAGRFAASDLGAVQDL